MVTQGAVSVRAMVRPGALAALEKAMVAAQHDVDAGTSCLAALPGVHFARLLVLPGDPDVDGVAVADSVVYTADVDGSARRHLRALSRDAAPLLDAVLTHCEGYPAQPDPGRRVAWLREHEIGAAAHYVNTIGLGVEQIVEEAVLHDWLQEYVDANRPELATRAPGDLHGHLRDVVERATEVRFAVRPAPPLSPLHRLRALAEVAGTVAVLLLLLPVLVVVTVPWLVGIRRLERSDVPWSRRPDAASVDRLREQEDHFAYNTFAAMGRVKPGPLRRRTVRVVLRAIAFAVRHVFARGSLAGVTTIHFARWVMLDDQKRVLFTSCYDGSLESYMDDFIDKLAWGLNVVFSNGVGYPRTRWLVLGGARDEQRFKDYLRCHQLGASVAYAAYPTLTTANMINNAAVRDGLTRRRLDDATAAEWLARL